MAANSKVQKSKIETRIAEANAGRDPDRLALKYAAMRADAFGFLRGTCSLYYKDLDYSALPAAPVVWCCGDLHLQNFGTYKGQNRLTYFDLNDFDEACLAPASWDLVRLLSSVIVAGSVFGMDERTVDSLNGAFLTGYRTALSQGKAGWVERATSNGWIRALLLRLKKRTRRKFLATRTMLSRGQRSLILDGRRALPLDKGQRSMLRDFMSDFASQQPEPEFFHFIDAARRIAGTGSLGLERFAVLVQGRGSPDGNFLLDLKLQPGPAATPKHGTRQPSWKSEAHRVATVQHMVEAVAPALLQPVKLDGRSFLLRELMPTNDRLNIAKWHDDIPGFHEVIRSLGEMVAWGNLRSASRKKAALADELIDFGNSKKWAEPLLHCAAEAAARTETQWREFAGPEAIEREVIRRERFGET
ncbi:MAG TPA: DUF2252 family protein [Bryobacteraceae bacterium]|nr:DUF2252 family protein [Bryobacteraceae bacterium]